MGDYGTARDLTHLEIAQRMCASGDVTPEAIAAAMDCVERTARRDERQKCADKIADFALSVHEESIRDRSVLRLLPDEQSRIDVAGWAREQIHYAGHTLTSDDRKRP